MATDSSIINRIRADLASIDDLAPPPPTSSSHTSSSAAILADYVARRDEYINNKALVSFMNSVKENKTPEYDPAAREQINQQKQVLLQEFKNVSESLNKTLIEKRSMLHSCSSAPTWKIHCMTCRSEASWMA